MELEQAELSRLDVVTRWRHFVSRVAEDAAKAYRNIARDVRLVISIDDADMNPRRCVELLDLLRMLWAPAGRVRAHGRQQPLLQDAVRPLLEGRCGDRGRGSR